MGAGILPVTIYRNKIYFLFSREHMGRDGGMWGEFGGGKEKNETYFETAIRECHEESNGFLGSKKDIKNLIKKKFVKKITLFKKYRTYIVYIPYDNTLPKRFRKDFLNVKKNNPEKICRKGMYEKDMLKWVSFDKLGEFSKKIRPWYRNIIKLIIKYGI